MNDDQNYVWTFTVKENIVKTWKVIYVIGKVKSLIRIEPACANHWAAMNEDEWIIKIINYVYSM